MCEAQFSDKKVALKCNRGTKVCVFGIRSLIIEEGKVDILTLSHDSVHRLVHHAPSHSKSKTKEHSTLVYLAPILILLLQFQSETTPKEETVHHAFFSLLSRQSCQACCPRLGILHLLFHLWDWSQLS